MDTLKPPPDRPSRDIAEVLRSGDPEQVQALIDDGVDLSAYRDEQGHDALLTAMFGRDIAVDANLIPLLRLLASQGVALDAESSHRQSALSVLSYAGRFDAVLMLLEAGADERFLAWTPLSRAVAFGRVEEVRALLAGDVDLEAQDRWYRTPFLLALAAGHVEIASLLADAGADEDALDHVGRSALSHAVASRRSEPVRWLLARGVDVDGTDKGGSTALRDAVEANDLAIVDLLLTAGADPDHEQVGFPALATARSRVVANRLLDAGADPKEMTCNVQRLFTQDRDCSAPEAFNGLSAEDFDRDRTRRFGRANPELMSVPFWRAMVRSGLSGFDASQHFGAASDCARPPVWCAQRFGQSLTLLLDGRVVQVAGEHEDHYDPDFCIYNDVIVHHPDGALEIFGYPKEDFPPTDFHTATLIGENIVLIGSLGYAGERSYGSTPVFRLDTRTWRIERVKTQGEAPGWIYRHRARYRGSAEIEVTGGKVLAMVDGREESANNRDTFVLDLAKCTWSRLPAGIQ